MLDFLFKIAVHNIVHVKETNKGKKYKIIFVIFKLTINCPNAKMNG